MATAATPSPAPACACGCTDARGSAGHPVNNALAIGDLDRAFALGLMDVAPCPACTTHCLALLDRVQGERRQALAARARYRQREARLERRRLEREQRRAALVAGVKDSPKTTVPGAVEAARPFEAPRVVSPALPPAAAAALARAQAKVAARAQAKSLPGLATQNPPEHGPPEHGGPKR
ncbi:hypothetical protein [Novilysobacter avium]|uniref:Uncharacterized protein n=1 Tax=Novilysobacter avium TaxID=2781023 RepID=A0A7S6UJC0_9GAMM|nr:hypothetical protein INQ42_08585 [Lysobacter avium]